MIPLLAFAMARGSHQGRTPMAAASAPTQMPMRQLVAHELAHLASTITRRMARRDE